MRFSNPAIKLFAATLVLLCAFLFLSSATGNSAVRPSAGPAARSVVLAELFTSEGCSSCPPADALLGHLRQDLAQQGVDVIPLGFHVDYWNSLGWRDRFSSAEFTHRQENYARLLGTNGPYTPQMVIDGVKEFVGNDKHRAYAAIAEAAARAPRANIELSVTVPGKLMVKTTSAIGGVPVMLAITEDNLSTNVGAGENSGRELRHSAVVRELRQLGLIQNGSFTAEVPLMLEKEWKPADLRAVVFVQQGGAGEVLGAASVILQMQAR